MPSHYRSMAGEFRMFGGGGNLALQQDAQFHSSLSDFSQHIRANAFDHGAAPVFS